MATQKQVTYEIDNDRRRRLTVVRCSALGLARYNVYLREGRAWLAEQGIIPGEGEAPDAERQLMALDRASCLASLAQVEEAAADGEFEIVEAPEAWWSVEGFLNDIPAVVFDVWSTVARGVNPGLWPSYTDAEKNAVAVIVT